MRDQAPSTLGGILPLLRRIAESTAGSPRGLIYAGALARILSQAGRLEEAEDLTRQTIREAVRLEQFRTACVKVGDLINILRQTGRSKDALALVDEMKEYTRRAGLGPWTQLVDEGQRLQILNELGNYEEVLSQVEELRTTMANLAASPVGKNEAANPWNVREVILDAGHSAALRLEQWETALSLNREVLEITESRGAPPLEIAGTKFNDYGPLIRLKRFHEARRLLDECRAAFEIAGGTSQLGMVFSALADLEDQLGNTEQSVHHERTALRYSYIAGEPGDCAISHFNLANYLIRTSAPPETALAHRLADALICAQTSDGTFPQSIAALARHLARLAPAPPLPRDFNHLCELVDQIEGVHFRDLFDRLPKEHAATGDEALQKVLAMAKDVLKKQNPGAGAPGP